MHCINNMNGIASGLIIASCVFYSCTSRTGEISPVHEQQTDSLSQDTIVHPEVKPVNKKLTAEQIEICRHDAEREYGACVRGAGYLR